MSQADAMTRAQRGTAADQARANPRARWMIHAAAGAIACASLVPSAMPAHAQAQGQAASSAVAVPIDIASQPLAAALMQLARQTNVDISAPSRVTRGRTAPAVSGTLTVPQALARLLAGTPLSARALRANAYVVEAPGESLAAGGGRNRGSSYGEDAVPEGREGIAEILVVGSRSQNVDIRRTEDDPQPYVVFQGEEIQNSGASSLEEFLARRLTMNTSSQSNNQRTNNIGQNNRSDIGLRGFGSAQTLILVDGRRAPRVLDNVTNSGFTQADINGIPIAAIDRVEVLPSTASAIYGGGAVGGVINIIRKRDYRGLQLTLRGGGTFRGGGEEFGISVTGGFGFNHKRTQLTFALSHLNVEPLFISDNKLVERGRAIYEKNDPTKTILLSDTANIKSAPQLDQACLAAGGTFTQCFRSPNLVLDNGTPLGSPVTHLPNGYAGYASDQGAGLLANAGHFNTELAPGALGERASLRNHPRVRSANVNVRHDFGPKLSAYADFSIYDNLGRGEVLISTPLLSLSATDTRNPFQQGITVTLPMPDIVSPLRSSSTSKSATVGIVGRVAKDVRLTAEYSQSKSKIKYVYLSNPFTTSVQQIVDSLAINPLVSNPFSGVDLDQFRRTEPDVIYGPFTTRQQIWSTRAAGSAFRLPGGDAAFTALIEYRRESALRGEFVQGASHFVVPERSQNVTSAYLELLAPVLKGSSLPLVQDLELQLSLRHDRYSTRFADPTIILLPANGQLPSLEFGTAALRSTDFTLAGRWTIIEGLTVRASYATGFLPPSITQLVQRVDHVTGFYSVFDPMRGGTSVNGSIMPLDVISNGNPNLKPEESKSYSVGVIAAPRFLPGLRMSADFTDISKSMEIGSITGQQLLELEALFPERVVRGPNLPGDAPGWAGPIIRLDTSLINASRSRSKALDLKADYEFEFSNGMAVQLRAAATRQWLFKRKLLPTSVPFNSVGFFDGPLKWRGNAGVDLSAGSLRLGWNLQYYSSHKVTTSTQPTNPAPSIREGRSTVPAQLYNDLYLSYAVSRPGSPLDGLVIGASILNVFDKLPPYLARPYQGFSGYGDARLRRFQISATKPLRL